MPDHIDKEDPHTVPPHPYMAEPRGYALSGRIMLSAIIILFAVVVIMVCLHVYARWYILRARRRQIRRARRRTHLVFYIESDNPGNIIPVPTRGLDAAVLKSLPTFTYVRKEEEAAKEGGDVLECAVCLSEFEDREKGRLLPKCNHSFHVECIDMWFHSHSTCPICRATVDAADVKPSEVASAVGDEVDVELASLCPSQLGAGHELNVDVGGEGEPAAVVLEGPSVAPPPPPLSSSPSLSFGGRRKGVELTEVSVEVPPRRSQSFCFPGSNSDESGSSRSPSGFKSPTSRILSLKRILSREKRSPLPSPSAGPSHTDSDIESGRVDLPSQAVKPR